tara:strand:- start:32628 stop:34076 length:1449 start_codon:yes stop_codon:yes gene_type:complete
MALSAEQVASQLAQQSASMLINGEQAGAAVQLEVMNPSAGERLAFAPDASASDIDSAVLAARAAYPAWSSCGIATRRAALMKLADAIENHREELTLINSLECGVPVKVARSVDVATRYLRSVAAMDLPVEVLRENDTQRIELARASLGVVAAITPWNAPMTLAAAKIAAALLAGNTMVLKPSPFAPLATLRIGELAREIFPAGVLNIVSGGAESGEALTTHPQVDKISFTGSVGVGKHIMGAASHSLKRLTLELGGNDAAIVLADVDPKIAAPNIARIAFANCGQFCMAIKRLYVERDIADELTEALIAEMRSKRLGDALDAATDIGPVQNIQQYERLQQLLQQTRDSGAQLVPLADVPAQGYFIAPTIVTGVDDRHTVVAQEQFGPILPIIPVDSAEQGLQLANAGRFGLGGSIWSTDVERASALARRLEVGTAWVNQHGMLDAEIPMNGVKDSGIGVEYGVEGLKGYTAPRVLNIAKTTF